MGVTRLLLLGLFYTIQTKRDQTLCTLVYMQWLCVQAGTASAGSQWNRKAAQKCILVFQVAQGNSYMSMGQPGLLTKSIQDHLLHRVQQVHWNQRVNWAPPDPSRSIRVHQVHQVNQSTESIEYICSVVSLVLLGPQSQRYVQAFYIINRLFGHAAFWIGFRLLKVRWQFWKWLSSWMVILLSWFYMIAGDTNG